MPRNTVSLDDYAIKPACLPGLEAISYRFGSGRTIRSFNTKILRKPDLTLETTYRKALVLEYFTVFYNFLEAAAAIIFGRLAGSTALIGFGLDSVVENLSAFVLIWRLKKHGSLSKNDEERIEKTASRIVGITFFLLGTFIAFESTVKIVNQEKTETSVPGMIIAVLSLIIMPVLARAKYNLGKSLSLESLVADSKETLVCAVLSAALLLGLSANALFSFWLADPIAGLVIAVFVFREGFELVSGEND